MGFTTLITGAYAVMNYLTKKEERQQVEYESHNGEAQGDIDQRIMIADCIEDVYTRAKDKGEGNTFGQRWREHHYEFVSLQNLLEKDPPHCNDRELKRLQKRLEKEERKKYIAVLRKKDSAGANPAGPDWMVAIRGTIFPKLHDLTNNLKTSLELLHTSSTVKLLKIVILRLVKIMRVEGSDPSKLVVAGHSLGAAKAMLVTRMLALGPDRLFLNCHFFNPPYAAFASVVIEGVRKLSSPIFDFARLNAEGIWDKFTTVEALVSYAFNTVVDDGKMIDKLYGEFITLSDWSPPPRFYLNEYDILSSPFIRHFKHPKGIFKFYPHAGRARAMFDSDHLETKTFHLFPRGSICTAYTGLILKTPVEAHSLDTWTRRDLQVVVEDVNLVDEDEKRMYERTGAEENEKIMYERAGAEEDSEEDDGDSEGD